MPLGYESFLAVNFVFACACVLLTLLLELPTVHAQTNTEDSNNGSSGRTVYVFPGGGLVGAVVWYFIRERRRKRAQAERDKLEAEMFALSQEQGDARLVLPTGKYSGTHTLNRPSCCRTKPKPWLITLAWLGQNSRISGEGNNSFGSFEVDGVYSHVSSRLAFVMQYRYTQSCCSQKRADFMCHATFDGANVRGTFSSPMDDMEGSFVLAFELPNPCAQNASADHAGVDLASDLTARLVPASPGEQAPAATIIGASGDTACASSVYI